MPEESEEGREGSLVKNADRTKVITELMGLGYERWGKVGDGSSYNAALRGFRFNVSSRPTLESGVKVAVYEVSFFQIVGSDTPDRKVFEGEDAQKLYEHLAEGDKRGEIRRFGSLQELVEKSV
ncbi:hypothetical protein J4233_01630 [Candidatus Pacearchaeota archaeon]|nr:hypothetical protein [Candidatus Pacearchaeota archaeon]